MLHLIGKNLWARRYRNGWLLAELIIVSMVIWVLTDPIVVTTHDRGLPTGITEEGMYRLNLAAVSSKSARFEAGEDTPEARAANVRRILSRIRDYEDVRYATLQFRDVGPFCSSSWSRSLNTDSLHYYPYMVMFFEPQSQFFSTFGFEEVEGQTNEELDRMPFENKEVVMTVDPVPGVVSLGYRYVDFKTDTLNWIIKATIGKLRMRNGMQPQNVLAEPQQLEKFEIPEEVCIVFRTKPAINETQFMQHFRPWAEKELRVGNLYMRSVKSYHEVIADNDEENTVNYTYRVNLLMGGFFLISLCLGVSGTFWMQTRNRREEVGIMKSFGARSVYIIRMLLGEGIVLSTLATLTGCLIYLQYALKEGLYTNMWNEQEILPIYWVNRFPLHFLGVSLIVWIILLIVVSIGIYIPACSISRITPVDALRDE